MNTQASSDRTPLRTAMRLGVVGLLLLAAAGVRHHLAWGGDLHWLLAAFETACLVGFAWCGGRAWLRGIAAVRAQSPGIRQLVRTTWPLLAAAIVVPPFLSLDVTDYVMRGRVLAVHGGNPYVDMAAKFADDPFLAFGDLDWKHFPLPYGPVVADVQGAIAWLAHVPGLPPRAELVLAVVLFKVLFAACLLASALTARAICERLRPADADAAFVAVAWNPLLLNECIATAHNEPLVLLAVLVALRTLLAGRAAASGAAAGVGVLCKIVPVLLGPLLAVWSARHRTLPALAAGCAAAGALLAVYWFRFFAVPGGLDFLQRQSGVTGASPAWAIEELTGADSAFVVACGRVLVVAAMLAASVALWRRPQPATLLRGSAAILAAMATCGLAGFGPWYHVWWIPIALVLGSGFLHRFAVAATLVAPLGYVLWTSLRTLDERHEWTQLSAGLLVPLLIAASRRRSPAPPAATPAALTAAQR